MIVPSEDKQERSMKCWLNKGRILRLVHENESSDYLCLTCMYKPLFATTIRSNNIHASAHTDRSSGIKATQHLITSFVLVCLLKTYILHLFYLE